MSPTPIPFRQVPATASPTPGSRVVFRDPVIQTVRTPVLEEERSQPAPEHQIPVIIEEQFAPVKEITKQKLFVFAKEGPFTDDAQDVFANDVFKQPNKKENFIEDPAVIQPAVLGTKTVTPPFDPRRRRITTKKPKLSGESIEETGQTLLDSSSKLTDRLKQLRETIRKTKESLTAQKSLFTSRQPTAAPKKKKKVRVRGRKRVRVPASKRPGTKTKENLILRRPEDNSNIISVVIEEKPRSSGRGRGRQKIEISPNGIVEKKREKKKKESQEKKETVKKQKQRQRQSSPDKLETELEEKYGVSVVQGLLGVLNTAVSHPDKDRILNQLKGQLEAMDVEAVRKLQFESEEETETTTPVVIQTDSEDDKAEEDGLGSELARQLARVSSLAGRFNKNKPLLVGSERQVIKHNVRPKFELDREDVATPFPVEVPEDVFVVMPEVTTVPPREAEEDQVVATTLRNLFQTTERLQKIKMSPTTPVTVTEELVYENILDGIPDGSPGLTKNFFERVPFLPHTIT